MSITGYQLIAARGLLRWTQGTLAEKAKVAPSTIKRLEGMPGELSGHAVTIDAVIAALVAAGVIFIAENGEGPGVRLRKDRPE